MSQRKLEKRRAKEIEKQRQDTLAYRRAKLQKCSTALRLEDIAGERVYERGNTGHDYPRASGLGE
jgi:hypothetical protein